MTNHVQCLSLQEKYEEALDVLKINCRANNINYDVLHFMRFDKKAPGELSFLCARNLCDQLDHDNCPEGLRCCRKAFSVKAGTRICTKATLQNCFWKMPGGYGNNDLPTLKFRWKRWVDLRGSEIELQNAFTGFRQNTLNNHMAQKHRHHKNLVSMYSAGDKKTIEDIGRVKLSICDYSKAKERHKEIIPGPKIENRFTTF